MSTTTFRSSWVLQVARGNMAVVMPVTDDTARRMPVGELAVYVIGALMRGNAMEPGRATHPILPDDRMPLALRVAGRDAPLDPRLPLLAQTEGRWTDKDIPVEGQTEATARLPVCELELIDASRPIFAMHDGARVLV